MIEFKGENTVLFDVDGTLFLHDKDGDIEVEYGNSKIKGRAHTYLVNCLVEHKKRGWNVIVFSNNGMEHCKKIIHALGIEEYVSMVMTKPSKCFDNEDISKWLRCIHIPENTEG